MKRPDPRSDAAKSWRHLYGTAAWKRARQHQLDRQPLCEKCTQQGITTPATVVNHRKPHQGNLALFIDPANHESACKLHHDSAIQSHERTGIERGCDANGVPNDPASHWRGK